MLSLVNSSLSAAPSIWLRSVPPKVTHFYLSEVSRLLVNGGGDASFLDAREAELVLAYKV